MPGFSQSERERIKELVASRRAGYGLPRSFYHDELAYRVDIDAIWRQGWLFAGHTCQIPNPGDYFLYDIDTDSIIIVRGDDGQVNALHNVCRHRGTLICAQPEGHVKRFVCPYHQWTYGRDGQLLFWRGMQQDLDRLQLGLHKVHVREVEGLIYIALAENPPDFQAAYQTIAPLAKLQGFNRAKVAKIGDYVIPANWKLVWENNRECFHCNVNHPQYIKANFDHYNADDLGEQMSYQLAIATRRLEDKWAAAGYSLRMESGLTPFPDADKDIWYSANRTPLVEGYVSESMDGKQVAPLMGDYSDPDVGTLRIRTLPNFWNHASCDHGVTTRLTPAGPYQTYARLIWLVDADAVEGRDYVLDKLVPFWQLTAEQDWEICERAQRGINSRAYTPGPLSTYKEYNVDAFLRWYLRQLSEAVK